MRALPLLLVVLAPSCATPPAHPPARAARPNVVLILADDMGQASVSAYHQGSGLPTPHLDALAQQGLRFTDAHSGSAVCSPTRYGLLTGRYSWRTRMKSGIVGKWRGPLIADERTTLPEMLRAEGYRTWCVGKWHLGWNWPDAEGRPTTTPKEIDYARPIGGGPLAHGFDRYLGDDVPNWPPYVWIEGDRAQAIPTARMTADGANGVSAGPATPGWSLEAVLPALTARCVDHIRDAADDEEPFFLFFSMTSPHTPINPSAEFTGRSGVSRYADFLLQTDQAVGQVIAALDENGLADDTLVIFVADNGTSPKADFDGLSARGVDLRAHWRGHKADVWEGGHRVPFIVRWPGHVAENRSSDTTVSLVDVMATVADAVGHALPDNTAEDSTSLLPILRDEQRDLERDGVVTHSSSGRFAIHSGRWKLAFCPGSGGWSQPRGAAAQRAGLPARQLYDMHADPAEQRNLAAEHPEVVATLTARLRTIVENGRSTPGTPQANDRPWWQQLPWPKPTAEVRTWGTLREALRDGHTEARVALAAVARPGFTGVGAATGLDGEVTILDGEVFVTRVREGEPTAGAPDDASATVLFGAEVAGWQTTPITEDIDAGDLAAFVQREARRLGVDVARPFPFVVEGELMDLEMHVIAGDCPVAARMQGRKPKALPWHHGAARAQGRLVGIHARDAGGVITHHGATSHVHAVIDRGGSPMTGHCEAVGVAAGSTLRLPAVAR